MDEDKLKEDDFMKEVSRSIGEQVEQGENKEQSDEGTQKTHIDTMSEGTIDTLEQTESENPSKKKWSWKKKLLVTVCSLLGIVGIACAGVYYMLDQVNRDDPSLPQASTDLTAEELKKQQENLVTPSFDDAIESKVVNILLIGEEAMDDGDLGRSDSMMIATINIAEKSLKLTSLMRDTYVTIPGYHDNKLNAAYHNGGGVLLTETIEQNFGVKIDGYVRVDYQGFEDIIDELGGVDIDISESEAEYLNTTNYISKKKNRTLTAGSQTLNGNQALGYCRVRYRKASNGEANDFGRTYRQRTVLTAIFNKYKSTSLVNMITIAQNMLSNYVATNMTKTDMIKYITCAVSLGTTELETSRIPIDGSYESAVLDCGSGNYRDVLQIDMEANKQAIREFIYAGLDDEDLQEEVNDDTDRTVTDSYSSTSSPESNTTEGNVPDTTSQMSGQ